MPKVNMRKALAVFFLLIPLAAFGQYISYWFQGWQRQGNARDAQEYFMVPGTGITFTYAPTNRVIINASGSNACTGLTTNFAVLLWTGSTTNVTTLYFTNGLLKNMIGTAPTPPVTGQNLTDDQGQKITDDQGTPIQVFL